MAVFRGSARLRELRGAWPALFLDVLFGVAGAEALNGFPWAEAFQVISVSTKTENRVRACKDNQFINCLAEN